MLYWEGGATGKAVDRLICAGRTILTGKDMGHSLGVRRSHLVWARGVLWMCFAPEICIYSRSGDAIFNLQLLAISEYAGSIILAKLVYW